MIAADRIKVFNHDALRLCAFLWIEFIQKVQAVIGMQVIARPRARNSMMRRKLINAKRNILDFIS